MGAKYSNFSNGISLEAKITGTNSSSGDVEVVNNKLNYHNGTSSSPVVTEAHSATLTNKSISLTNNTITGTSTELATAISDETGSGSLVFANTPTLITPVLGAATATSINGLTISNSTGTLTIANGKTVTANNTVTLAGTDNKTLTLNNTLTFNGTDSSTIAFGTGGTVTYTSNNLSVFSSTTSSQLAGVISDETGTGVLVFNDGPSLTNPEVNALKLINTGTVTLSAATSSATYALTLPAIAPITGTALYYDGADYVWQSVATAKKTKYDIIVGSSAEVTAGAADYTSLTSAIAALPAGGGSILVSSGYPGTENITVNKDNVTIEGQGNLSVITGTLTFSATTDNCSVSNLRINGNITFTAGCKYNFLTTVWVSSSATLTDSGTANYINAIQE